MSLIAKKIIDEKSFTLQMITGETLDNEKYYSYVLFQKSVFEEIKEKIGKETFCIGDYGLVIHSGYGSNPPEGLEDKVLEYFQKNYLKDAA